MAASKSNKSTESTPRRPGRPAGRTAADGVIANRAKLLATAEQLIQDNGPGVSLAAIASEAGVTKPTLYREVGDRDALVRLLAERLAARIAVSVARLVDKASSPQEELRNFAAGYLKLAAQERNLYLFVTAVGTNEDRVQQSLLLADGAAGQISVAIAASRTAAGQDPGVAKVWSYGLIGALHYVTLWWLRDQDAPIEQVIDQIAALLWSGMQISNER